MGSLCDLFDHNFGSLFFQPGAKNTFLRLYHCMKTASCSSLCSKIKYKSVDIMSGDDQTSSVCFMMQLKKLQLHHVKVFFKPGPAAVEPVWFSLTMTLANIISYLISQLLKLCLYSIVQPLCNTLSILMGTSNNWPFWRNIQSTKTRLRVKLRRGLNLLRYLVD